VIGRKDLNSRSDLRLVTDRDLHYVEDHAVEIQEHARAQTDVETIIAIERRPIRRSQNLTVG